MKRWTLVDKASTPDGTVISLYEHDGEYCIRAGVAELMSTRQHASEEQLAELACAHVRTVPGAHILVGGLGFGFTLKAALKVVRGDATIVVAEFLQSVIDWNRNPKLPLAATTLADPRVVVTQRDVGDLIGAATRAYDAIILDVDNGPAALSTTGNQRLYSHEGLRRTHAALRPAGCAGFWSAAPDLAFERLLASAGFTVEVHRVRAHANSGRRHTLFLGRVR